MTNEPPPAFIAELVRFQELQKVDSTASFWHLVRGLEALLQQILADHGLSAGPQPRMGSVLAELVRARLLPERFVAGISMVVQHRNLLAHARPMEVAEDFSSDLNAILELARWHLQDSPGGPRLSDDVASGLLSEASCAIQTGRVPRSIFLCYAKEDESRVSALYDQLASRGHQPWMDKRELLPGQTWEEEIERAIRRADFFVACMSSRSVSKRGYVNREVQLALDVLGQIPHGQIFLIPVCLEPCEVPAPLRRLHWLDIGTAESYERLFASIESKRLPTSIEEELEDAQDGRTSR